MAAICINLGGECHDDECIVGFEKLRNDQPRKCRRRGRICCVKTESSA